MENEARIPVKLRQAAVKDAEAIAALLSQLGYPPRVASVLERIRQARTSPNDHVLVALLGGKPVGVASIHYLPYFPTGGQICRVTALVVESEQRGRGIGAQLVEVAESLARGAGCEGIELTASSQRQRAHRFYQRLGYEVTSLRFYKHLEPPDLDDESEDQGSE